MKTSFRVIIPLALAVILAGWTVGCDSVENDGQRPILPPGQKGGIGSKATISDAELDKAAAAYAEIQVIRQQMQQSVQQTQDPNERQRLQLEANQRMVQAAENAGLDFETYNSIMGQVRSNNELGERFRKKIQSMP